MGSPSASFLACLLFIHCFAREHQATTTRPRHEHQAPRRATSTTGRTREHQGSTAPGSTIGRTREPATSPPGHPAAERERSQNESEKPKDFNECVTMQRATREHEHLAATTPRAPGIGREPERRNRRAWSPPRHQGWTDKTNDLSFPAPQNRARKGELARLQIRPNLLFSLNRRGARSCPNQDRGFVSALTNAPGSPEGCQEWPREPATRGKPSQIHLEKANENKGM